QKPAAHQQPRSHSSNLSASQSKTSSARIIFTRKPSHRTPAPGSGFKIRVHPRLNKPIACNRHRVLSIVAATALTIVLRRLRDDERHFNPISQPDQPIGKLRRPVKRLDLVPQVAQLANRTRQTIRATYEPDVMPHDVLNRLHVALDQRRIRVGTQPTLIPRRNIPEPRRVTIPFTQRLLDLNRRTISPNE